jgi:transcriptional regulator with XRE-family HTH domain
LHDMLSHINRDVRYVKVDQSMSYATEQIVASLKKARENKKLSQRELSKRSGVPQSHISKIETSGVDLRLSSLAALAHALDLELALVPRKAAPAVRSIARSTGGRSQPNSNDAIREVTRTLRALNALPEALQENAATHMLRKHLDDINRYRDMLQQTDALRHIRSTLERVENVGSLKALQQAAKEAQRVRNMVVHAPSKTQGEPPESRPAYSLDEEDDDV